MHRREFLTGTAGTFLTACTTAPRAAPRVLTPVPPVLVQRERILKTLVGLRPYRTGGYRLSEETINGKNLVHNYGHGGDGVSLSWGCAQMAAERARLRARGKIAIMGSGVMGLTTGFILASWGHEVSIYAKDFPPNTTSNIAGALILVPDDTDPRIARYCHEGWERYVGKPGYGVKYVNHRFLGERNTDTSANGFLGRRVRRENPTVLVDPGIYLARLVEDFKSLGGALYSKRFETTADVLALEETTIVNCTGLGAGDLFLDSKVLPVRGQLTLLQPQPEIDYSYIAREPGLTSLYMFPRETSIVLGGTRKRGVASRIVDPSIIERVMEGHGEMASWAGGATVAGV